MTPGVGDLSLESPTQGSAELQRQYVVARNSTIGQLEDGAEPWIRRGQGQAAEAIRKLLGVHEGIHKAILDQKIIAIVTTVSGAEGALCTDALLYFKTPLGILRSTVMMRDREVWRRAKAAWHRALQLAERLAGEESILERVELG